MKLTFTALAISSIVSSYSLADIVVVATPDNIDPFVEELGGKIPFDRSITNNNAETANLRVSDYVIFPNGGIYHRNNKKVTLEPGQVFSQTKTKIKVPAEFPVGPYEYVLSVYNQDTGDMITERFAFQKKGQYYATCNDILMKGGSNGDGIYTIDIDGSGPMPEFNAYCDMTTEGGGWTLFANHKDGIKNIVAVDEVNPDVYGVMQSDRWNALKASMTEGMLFIDENNLVTSMNLVSLYNGNCRDISSVTDLANIEVTSSYGSLWHNEASGCSIGGLDYSLIYLSDADSSRRGNYVKYGASFTRYNNDSVPFDLWPYVSTSSSASEQDELLYFIK